MGCAELHIVLRVRVDMEGDCVSAETADPAGSSNKNVKNVAVGRDTGMQALCPPNRAAKGSQREWNFEVQGRMSRMTEVSRERCGNIVQSEL